MDRLTALRLEGIRHRTEGTRFTIELLARLHVVAIAAALALAGSSIVGAVAGQVGGHLAAMVFALSLLLVVAQIRALQRLSQMWADTVQQAARDIDRLKIQEVEQDVDASPTHAPGTRGGE